MFDEIPEDREESHPCPCGGNITEDENSGHWVCDQCGYDYTGKPD